MIVGCGAWTNDAYANVCLRCERTGKVTVRKQVTVCDCCGGRGMHKIMLSHDLHTGKKPRSWK